MLFEFWLIDYFFRMYGIEMSKR